VVVKDGDTQSPATNVDVPLLAPQLGTVDPATGNVVVTGKPGSTAQVQDQNGNPIGKPVTLDDKGQGTVTLPGNTSGQQVGVVVKDGDTQSPATNVDVPLLAPQLGTVDPETGNVAVTGKPGATVQVQDQNGNPIGKPVTLDDKGQGTVTLPGNTSGQQVGVALNDGINPPLTTNVEVPLLAPQLGPIDPATGNVVVTGKPGATVQAQDANGKPIGNPVTLDDKGQGTVTLPGNTSGQQVGVALNDGTNPPLTTNVEVPLLAPQLGPIDPATGNVVVTGKPGATVQAQDPSGKPIGNPVTLDDKGQGTVTLPGNTSGQQVGVVLDDGINPPLTTNVDVPLLAPQLGPIDPATGNVVVTGKPGATVQAQDPSGKPIGNPVTLDDKGQGTITLPGNTSGQQVGVALDDGINPPLTTNVEVPLLAPQLGPIDPATGNVVVTGKPGATVQAQDANGKPIGNPVTLDDKGQGTVTLPGNTSGQQVGVALDDGINPPLTTNVDVPLLAPQLGPIDPATGNVVVTGKPGATVQAQDPSGKPIGNPVTLDDKGQGTVTLPGNTSGQQVGVALKDGINPPLTTNVDVPLLAPQLGPVDPATGNVLVTGKPGATVQAQDASGKPIGKPVTLDDKGEGTLTLPGNVSDQKVGVVLNDGINPPLTTNLDVPLLAPQLGPVDPATGLLPVIGKPGASVQLQDSTGASIGNPVVLDAQGNGTLTLPANTAGESVQAVQTSDTITSPTSPTLAIPTLTPTVGTIDPQTGILEVTGKPGATVQLKDSTGKTVGAPVTLDADGKGTLQIPTTLSDQPVTVTQTVDNNESLPTAPQTVPLLKPELGDVNAATGGLTVTGKPGATVQLQDSTGKPIGTPIVLSDEGEGVLTLPANTSGESVKAVQTSDTTTSPASDLLTVPVLTPIVGTIDPEGTLLVQGKPGATVQLKDSTGSTVGTPVTLDAQGQGSLQVPTTLSEQPVAVTQTVDNIESPPTTALTAPLLKPELGDVNASGQLLVTGKPGASVQLQDSEGASIGAPVILDEQGQFLITLPQEASGENLQAVQTSGTVQSPVSNTVLAPVLAPVVGAVDETNNLLNVQGKPNATVQLKDSTGLPIGNPVTLNDKGEGQIPLRPQLSSLDLTVTQVVDSVESGPSGVAVPMLTPILGQVDGGTRNVTLDGKPGALFQVFNDVTGEVYVRGVFDLDGKATVTLPFNASGQRISASQEDAATTSRTGALDAQFDNPALQTVEPAKPAKRSEKAPSIEVPLFEPKLTFNEDGTALEIVGMPGGQVEVKNAAGEVVERLTLGNDGKGNLVLSPALRGESVSVTIKDGQEESATVQTAIPLLKVVLGPVDPKTGQTAVEGKAGASVQLQDKDGKPVGSPVTLDAQGKGVISIPASLGAETLQAVQTFKEAKSPVSDALVVPLLAPTLAFDAAKEELSVTGKPNVSVQLQDKDGNPVGAPVQLDAQGHAVIKLPQALGGEEVGVVAQAAGITSQVATLEVPLLAPVFGAVDAVTGQVSVEGKPNAIVQINNPDGTIVRVPLDANGKGSVLLPSGASGEDLKATVSLGSLESAPATLSVPVLAPRDAVINDTGSAVTVKGKPGEIIKVMDASGKELGSGVVTKTGSVEIALSTPQKTGAVLSVTAYDEGKASPSVSVVAPFIDADLPLPPTDLNINPSGTRVLGKVKPGETVKIVNLDTQQDLGTFAAGPDGMFSANIPAQNGGDRLAISAVKGDKVSAPALLLVPLSAEDTPAKPFDVSVDATGTKVQGKGAPNTIVLIKAADDTTVIAKGIVGPDGTFEVTIPVQSGGQLLNVALQNNDKVSASESVMTPHIASNTPTEVQVDEAGTQVTGKGNTGETIRVKDAQGKEIGSGVVQQDGTFVVNIPKQPNGTTLAVTAQGQGVESAPAYVKTPVTEVDRPAQPEAHLDAAGTQISGKTLPGASVSVKDANGQLLAGPIVAGEDGTFAATITRQPAGSKISVVAELAGKESLPTELIAPQVAGEAIPAPLSAMISADGKLVSGKATPNTKVVVKNAAGETLGEQPVGADGNYAVPVKAQMGGTVLQVTSASLDNQSTSTGSVSVTAPYQLVAEHHEVEVAQFIDPNINELTEGRYNKFESVLISSFFPGNDTQSYEFSINANERAEVRVLTQQGLLSLNALNSNAVYLDKKVDGKWVGVQGSQSGGLLNVSIIPVLAGKSGISLKFETPGEYRVVIKNTEVSLYSNVEFHSTIIKESFVGGFANSLISSDLVLPTGATLVKVNGTLIAEQVRSVVQGKYGQLSISNDGQATYQQDRNATPADQTETFSYEARTADGATLNATFNIGIKAYSVSGDLVDPQEASIVSVDGKAVSATQQEIIAGQFGELKVTANGDYTYTPKLSLTGLNETETFTYQVRHTNGETVTSTLEVKIADSRLVAELNEVPTGVAPAADRAAPLAQPESQVDTDVDSDTALPSFNLSQGQTLDLNKLVSLQAKDDPAKPALTVTLNDILQADGTVSKSTSASTLDLPDSWKPDGVKAPLDGHEYVHYIDETSKKDLWVESGVSVV
jgi:VCBS repeat-containing protein